MVGGKTDVFPFFYSDMVPWGNTGSTTTHTVDDTSETFFTFNSQFDLGTESRRGVLVYVNDSLKVFGADNDYTFDTSEGAVIFTSAVSLAVNDVVKNLKDKNFPEVRRWVNSNLDNDSNVLLRRVYDALTEFLDGPSIAAAVLIVAKYQYQSAFVADQEINLLAALTEIMVECEFK